ncbi:hypothetical protein ACH42_01570 [Endozoicomonas sp. (ex Bugula neritina AB1)]|nr:hypothetical protein ACH42_01570 [Endozoicomonas sp. (ex Bugula neritina AB1)]
MRRCITTSSDRYKLAFAISMGGMLELYDFLIYGLMASYIAEQFFPANDSLTSLLATFATFAVGYLSRPLGGIAFGHFGDKYGRKKTFTLSIFLMAMSTALMGCLPNYSQIGLWAPVLLIILRLVQGFSIGGEIPGAITYLSESAPERQGLVVGILFLSLLVGISLGTFVHGFLTLHMSQEAMSDWGWRIPFWLGGSLGIFSYQIRKRFNESGFFLALDQAKQLSTVPLIVMFRTHIRGVFCGLMIMALCGATVTVYGIYMPSYLANFVDFERSDIAWHTALAFLMLSPVCILGGILTDLFNQKIIFLIAGIIVAFGSWPAFQYFVSEGAQLKSIMLICSLMAALITGLLPPLLIRCFPTEVRYTGIAFCYNLSFALFGGLAPFTSTLLIRESHQITGPAIYLILVTIFSMLILLFKWPQQRLLEEKILELKK